MDQWRAAMEHWRREYMGDWEAAIERALHNWIVFGEPMTKLQLKEGRLYRTRDGRKVGPIYHDPSETRYPYYSTVDWVDTWSSLQWWSGCGSFIGTDHPQDEDLVAEWVDGDATPYDERTTAPRETELERLVRSADEGERAALKLKNDPTLRAQVEVKVVFSDEQETRVKWEPLDAGTCGFWRWRVKPRPAFPEFRVGPGADCSGIGVERGWLVRLSDDGKTLHVGCQSFDAKRLRTALQCLNQGQATVTMCGSCMVATRAGIKHDTELGSHKLSWADADRLLAALEAYFAGGEKR